MVVFYLIFIVSFSSVEQYALAIMSFQNFESPCNANSRLTAPTIREEKANSILECSFLCADNTGITGPDEHCYGFNFCDTTHSCELLIGNQTSITSTDCDDLTTHSNCRFFKMQNVSDEHQTQKLDKLQCRNGSFRKVFQSTHGQSANISTLRNSLENGHEFRIRLNEWKPNKNIYLRADLIVTFTFKDKVCAQSIWNLDWDDVSGMVNQTFFIICTDTGISVQEWHLGPKSNPVFSSSQQHEMTWFSSGQTKRPIDHSNKSSLSSCFNNGLEFSILYDEPRTHYSVVVPFTSMFSENTDNQIVIEGLYPWSVSVDDMQDRYDFGSPLYWYSRAFHSDDLYKVNEWLVSTRETHLEIESAFYLSEWKFDDCWKFVYENEGEIHRSGDIGDLILYIEQGRRVRTVDSDGLSIETKSLLIGENEVWGLATMILKDSKLGTEIHYTRGISRLSLVAVDNITNIFALERQPAIKWFIDTSDWNKVYTTEDFRLGSTSLEVAFNGAIEYGAAVRVQIPYNLTQLFMTVDNMVHDVVENTLVATVVRHVHLNVKQHNVTFMPTPTSECFRIHTNGTVSISRFRFVTTEFVDSETHHDVPITWFVNH